MYQQKLAVEIENYINREMADSWFYRELSLIAPSRVSMAALIELSKDEEYHVQHFKQAYYYLTGRMYLPDTPKAFDIPDYEEALKMRILAETDDYRKYGEQYLDSYNKYLKDLFFRVKIVEARHAMRIPVLLQDIRQEA